MTTRWFLLSVLHLLLVLKCLSQQYLHNLLKLWLEQFRYNVGDVIKAHPDKDVDYVSLGDLNNSRIIKDKTEKGTFQVI